MSYITNIVLFTGLIDVADNEKGGVGKLNAYLRRHHGRSGYLASLRQDCGGDKNLAMGLYAAAINHLSVCDFLGEFDKIIWRDPRAVQLHLQRQDDVCPKCYCAKITEDFLHSNGLIE